MKYTLTYYCLSVETTCFFIAFIIEHLTSHFRKNGMIQIVYFFKNMSIYYIMYVFNCTARMINSYIIQEIAIDITFTVCRMEIVDKILAMPKYALVDSDFHNSAEAPTNQYARIVFSRYVTHDIIFDSILIGFIFQEVIQP